MVEMVLMGRDGFAVVEMVFPFFVLLFTFSYSSLSFSPSFFPLLFFLLIFFLFSFLIFFFYIFKEEDDFRRIYIKQGYGGVLAV